MTGQIAAAFRAELEAAGLRPSEIVGDGKLHRCPVEGKPGARDGAFVLHIDDSPSGWWQNWRTGQEGTWTAQTDRPLTDAERSRLAEQVEANRQKREAERVQAWTKAAERAREILSQAEPCQTHPYLEQKGHASCSLLMVDKKGLLLVPVLDPNGQVQSLQTIKPDGEKRFLPGGKMTGGYFPIKGDNAGPLLICEGLATGMSLYKATSQTVLVAFNAGNLEAVAAMARGKYPERPLIICGDNDLQTEGNPGGAKAEAAARALGCKMALPAFAVSNGGSDFNDLHQAEGLESVRTQLESAYAPQTGIKVNTTDGWPDPVPFNSFQAPPLPVGVFPAWAQDFILAAAEHLQVAPCLVTANVLGAVATTTARKMAIQVNRGYQEPMNLYILAPAPPAERKTAAQMVALRPLFEWEAARAHAMREEISKAQSQRKSKEAIINGLRTKLAKASAEKRAELMGEIDDLESSLAEIPCVPRLLADDITPEATACLMAAHGERLGIASCEGGLFDTLAGRYSNGVANLDLVLKAHAGETVRVDRKHGQPVMMDSPALTLCLSPQPEVLISLLGKQGFRSRGLLGRFAYILPQSKLGRRIICAPPIPEAHEQEYSNSLFRLIDMPWDRDENGQTTPYLLHLEPGACTAWAEFAQTIEPDLGEGGRFETVRDWAGKLPGLAARIAGNLHAMELLEQAPNRAIAKTTMNKALELAACLVGHALLAFGMMGADPEIEAAKNALNWIKREGLERFTLRNCHRGIMGRYPKAEQVRAALNVLEDRGYIFSEPTLKNNGPGRPPSIVYMVNPKVLGVD